MESRAEQHQQPDGDERGGDGECVLNCSTNAGTGGVTFASGGATPTTVATVDNAGDAQFNGTLQVGGTSQSTGTMTVRNNADAEVDYYLWPGLTTSQKGSFTYKDWNGNSQWYMVKDASNNWALNSATGGLDSFKAYQSTNSGDTYIDASNSTGHIRFNYETGSGAETDIYSGSSYEPGCRISGAERDQVSGTGGCRRGTSACRSITRDIITNTGSPCGSGSGSGGTSGTINSGSSGQIAYYTASGTTIGGMSAVPLTSGGTGATSASGAVANLLPGAASDGSSGITVQGNVAVAQSISKTSPYADIRGFGAVIDGATDIGSAVQSAVNECPPDGGTGGVSCVVLLPCGGIGCAWNTQTHLQPPSDKFVTVKVQGILQLGNTLHIYPGIVLQGDGGGTPTQFQNVGTPGQIIGPNVSGTLGTAITALNTPVTFTPTFTNGSISTFSTDSWITVQDPVTVSTSGSTASTAWLGTGYNVTATLVSYSRIAQGSLITISGCANTAYNATGVPVIYSDYSKQAIGWPNTSVGSGSTTGCTITGMNQDSFESVAISAVSGSTLTSSFMHLHSASALWGMAGVAEQPGVGPYELDWVKVSDALGAEFVADNTSQLTLIGDGFEANNSVTSIPAEMNTGLATIRDSSFASANVDSPNPCLSDCPSPSYPSGAVRFTYVTSIPNEGGCGYCWLENDTFVGGVEVDNNQVSGAAVNVPNFYNTQFREVPQNAITIDNRYGGSAGFVLRDPVIEDDFIGYPTADYVGYTDPGGYGMQGQLQIENPQAFLVQTPVNGYFGGEYSENNADSAQPVYGRPGYPVGTFTDGGAILSEIRSEGAGMGPSVIPFATEPTTTPTCAGNCTSTSVLAPDGTNNAVEYDAAAGGGGTPLGASQFYESTYAGDWILYGSWVRHGANQTETNSCSGGNTSFQLFTQGTDTIGGHYPTNFGMSLSGDWWHSQVGLATVTTGESTSHALNLYLYPGCSNGQGNQFFGWFVMSIPGPNNPSYSGVTLDEVERWRQELMHGYVPSGLPSGGGLLAMQPSHKLYWGNDTNLYRGAAGVVQTDGTINAVNGFEVNGAALKTTNLADWTNSGVAKWLGADMEFNDE